MNDPNYDDHDDFYAKLWKKQKKRTKKSNFHPPF